MNIEGTSVLVLPGDFAAEVALSLGRCGVRVHLVSCLEEALSRIESTLVDVALVPVPVHGLAAAAQLERLQRASAEIPLIAIGPENPELLREALRAGAADYLTWPATPEQLKYVIGSATARARASNRVVTAPVASGLLGCSPQLTAAREALARAAKGTATVLLRGETGTGKDLAARAIHEQSPRCHAPFVKVHTPALPDALLESELFGYEKGAFTGAVGRKLGRVELAHGGTLFLDEIGDLSLTVQTKLLRLIQDREYERLGGNRTLAADIRVVAATHRDLEHMVDSGTLREDLYYRINVVTVWLPPLRARREDIPLIANHYLATFAKENRKQLQLDDSALRELESERWPGNVRQLVNLIERLAVLSPDGHITRSDIRREHEEQVAFLTQAIPGEARDPTSARIGTPPVAASALSAPPGDDKTAAPADFLSEVRPLKEDVRRVELRAITKALRYAKGNRALAARLLGVSRRTLYTKLEEHGIE